MLKKLLKYDFKAVFKYWWIAAISSFALAVVGGFCISILYDSAAGTSDIELPKVLTTSATIILNLVLIGFSAVSIVSLILIFIRFYNNLFSDEGYLTFTLPVSRSQLLNSKLILGAVTELATATLLIINIITMLLIGFSDQIFTEEFWKEFIKIAERILKEINIYIVIYLIEALLFILITTVFSNLFTYCCITFASMITKKAKVITAIGIYYGATSIFSFVILIFAIFGVTSLGVHFADMPDNLLQPIIALIGLGILLFMTVFCAILYAFEYWMLDRKLNLA